LTDLQRRSGAGRSGLSVRLRNSSLLGISSGADAPPSIVLIDEIPATSTCLPPRRVLLRLPPAQGNRVDLWAIANELRPSIPRCLDLARILRLICRETDLGAQEKRSRRTAPRSRWFQQGRRSPQASRAPRCSLVQEATPGGSTRGLPEKVLAGGQRRRCQEPPYHSGSGARARANQAEACRGQDRVRAPEEGRSFLWAAGRLLGGGPCAGTCSSSKGT